MTSTGASDAAGEAETGLGTWPSLSRSSSRGRGCSAPPLTLRRSCRSGKQHGRAHRVVRIRPTESPIVPCNFDGPPPPTRDTRRVKWWCRPTWSIHAFTGDRERPDRVVTGRCWKRCRRAGNWRADLSLSHDAGVVATVGWRWAEERAGRHLRSIDPFCPDCR